MLSSKEKAMREEARDAIIRRIDDLGRVVIPKEIRRTLGIRVGDPLEIFSNGEVILIRRRIAE